MNRQDQETEKITQLVESLAERRKELNCIYQVNDILRDYSIALEEAFSRIMMVIPAAWRYADVCKVAIIHNGETYETEPFRRTKLKQIAPIMIEDVMVGEIQVYYTKPITNEKGIFLPEEQKLLNTIAEKLSGFILLKRLKDAFLQQQQSEHEHSNGNDTLKRTIQDWLSEIGLREEEISKCTRVKIEFRRGETICKQGALNAYIMILSEGIAKAYLEGYQEKGLNFKIIQPFDFVGLTSVRETDCYRFSVSAITPCTMYLIDKEEFMQMVSRNPRLNDYLVSFFCSFAGHLFTRLHCVANKQAPGRIADVLLYLTNEVFHGSTIPSIISRKDIAELAGMSTESAVRILSELKNDEIIRTFKEGIELLKPDLIRTISLAG